MLFFIRYLRLIISMEYSMSEKFQNKYRTATVRASWHDYNGGVYFVTISTANREHYFGEIVTENNENKMQMSEIGKYASENFANVSEHYPYAQIPSFVIMPDHIHAIVIIDKNDWLERDTVEAMGTSSLHPFQSSSRWKTSVVDNKMQKISHKRGSLSVVVGGLKRAITHFANQNKIPFAWQSRFHDHIVRDTNELNRIATYIENNIANWNLKK